MSLTAERLIEAGYPPPEDIAQIQQEAFDVANKLNPQLASRGLEVYLFTLMNWVAVGLSPEEVGKLIENEPQPDKVKEDLREEFALLQEIQMSYPGLFAGVEKFR